MRVLRRLGGFAALPFIGSVAPLLVLPIVARVAGAGGWASIGIGQALGNIAAVAVMFGWWGMGPARYADAPDDAARRSLYRESLETRLLVAAVVLPALAVASWVLASPGWELECLLMGLAIGTGGFSPNWYFIASGSPWSLARYETIPRSVATVVAMVPLVLTGQVWTYPAILLAVTVGTAVGATLHVGGCRGLGPRSVLASRRAMRGQVPIAASSAIGTLYTSTPLPIVGAVAPVAAVAGFTSGERLYRYGLFAVVALGNALQGWVLELTGPARRRRQRHAVVAHAVLGGAGALTIGLLGVPASRLLFGAEVVVDQLTAGALGLAFFCTSVATPLIRTVLIPAGRTAAVLRATVTGAIVGIPLMLLGVWSMGAGGAAVGLAASEAVVLLVVAAQALLLVRAPDNTEGDA